MSDQGRAYVWAYSPYKGVAFTIHLALGDLANDTHQHRIWTSAKNLAWKTRTTRQTATTLLGRMAEDGFLERLSDQAANGRPVEYRFLMPEVPIQFAPMLEGGVSRADTRVSAEITPGVSRADTEPKKNQREPKPLRAPRARDPMFDAIVTACGWENMKLTRSEAGRVARAKKELAEVGAVPELILAFGDDWNRLYAGASITPQGLAANWTDYRSGKLRELAGRRENGHLKGPVRETRNYDVDGIWARIAEEEGIT